MSAVAAAPRPLELGLEGFAWTDLHTPEGLARLHDRFEAWLEGRDPEGLARLRAARRRPDALGEVERSALVTRLAPEVGAFVTRLFGVEAEVEAASARIGAGRPVWDFRKHFVKKRLLRPRAGQAWEGSAAEAAAVARGALDAVTDDTPGDDEPTDEERAVAVGALRLHELHDTARKVARAGGAAWTEPLAARLAALREAMARPAFSGARERASAETDDDLDGLHDLDDEALTARACDAVERWLVDRRATPGDPVRRWPSLHEVRRQDFASLVPLRTDRDDRVGDVGRRTRAEPFALTDDRGSAREAEAQVDTCLLCHDRGKDSCRRGLRDKQDAVKTNPLGVALEGCPLDEKIGEAQALRRGGDVVGALVAITLDNPLCLGTGHRICNDCMKSCIFQKQEPVNVPQVETRIVDEVLALPWGYEIWSLLTRFHPLNLDRPTPRAPRDERVLVVGLGPAGYTLAHYLLNEGFGVVAIDGLKLEPLPDRLTGLDGSVPEPVRDAGTLTEPLDRRAVLGFGGVSEYGITVRWDKSFLTMLYLNLLRRARFRAYGGVRFGGTLTLDDAWELGFDHVAVAAGAGRPNLVRMKNGLARGVRQASDFLMALQLSGAFRRDSLANLQLRLPAVVIGSGLTAIDTATEALAYYVVQVEKTRERFEALCREEGEAAVRARFDDEEREVLDEALAHAAALAEERAAAVREGREPDFGPLLDAWGGVRIVYRRRLVDSPAYRLNHEEVTKSLEEGVRYVELLSPVEAHADARGAVEAVTFERQRTVDDGGRIEPTGERVRLPARSVFVAAGTKPNVSYEREHEGTFALDERGYFRAHVARRDPDGTVSLEPGDGFFTSARGPDGQTVSFYGDNHPRYAGSVVKAMASAKRGHRDVVRLFDAAPREGSPGGWEPLVARLDDELRPRVHRVRRLVPGIVEVVVRAPAAARRFRPGQFFRLQSYERHAPRAGDAPLTMEGLALTGASTDPDAGLLSLIVLEMGASSKLCAHLRPGEPVVVMGPTGRPSEIAAGEKVLLVGGGLGNAVLFSIARAFREAGSTVLYFAGYRRGELLFEREAIEAATDQVIWATDAGAAIEPRRPEDRHVRANVVEAMRAFAAGELGERVVELGDVDRILAIGSDGMMNAVARARHGVLKPFLKPGHRAIGSINSPMQCMLKEVCAQCLQRHVDPETGEERIVYSCFDQDQPLDDVDFDFLRQRLRQGSMQEKLSDLTLARLAADRAAE